MPSDPHFWAVFRLTSSPVRLPFGAVPLLGRSRAPVHGGPCASVWRGPGAPPLRPPERNCRCAVCRAEVGDLGDSTRTLLYDRFPIQRLSVDFWASIHFGRVCRGPFPCPIRDPIHLGGARGFRHPDPASEAFKGPAKHRSAFEGGGAVANQGPSWLRCALQHRPHALTPAAPTMVTMRHRFPLLPAAPTLCFQGHALTVTQTDVHARRFVTLVLQQVACCSHCSQYFRF